MIIAGSNGDQVVRQSRTSYLIQPGSWDANVMGWLGISKWAAPGLGEWEQNMQTAAVACAVRLVSESIGTMIARVMTGDALERKPLYDAPQAELFQHPYDGGNSFDFWQDLSASVEASTAGFAWKVRDRQGQIAELLPLDPDYFEIKGPPHAREVYGYQAGKRVEVTNDVIVVRSWSPKPAANGISTPLLHQRVLQYARSYDDYTGRWFDMDGTVSQVIEKGPTNRNDRLTMVASWMKQRKERNVGVLWGDATLKQAGPTLRDAAAPEIALNIAQQVARMYRILPATFLLASVSPERYPNLELPTGLFYRFSLLHRLRRIERTFSSDRELFPDRSQYLRFDATEFLRADTQTLASIAHNMKQDGSINGDEARALVLQWPPIPGGKGQEYQETPVGGGANLPPAAPAPAPPEPSVESAATKAFEAEIAELRAQLEGELHGAPGGNGNGRG